LHGTNELNIGLLAQDFPNRGRCWRRVFNLVPRLLVIIALILSDYL
jgi:hypothetical protein